MSRITTPWRHYANRRIEVLERDNYHCQRSGCDCADPERLTVHHIKPRCLGGRNKLRNLITLCDDCHREIHTLMVIPSTKKTGAYANIILSLLATAPAAIRGEVTQ